MEKELKEVWTSVDDKLFSTEKECLDYETKYLEARKNIKYFVVNHQPDLNEGRGWYGRTYFAVKEEGYSSVHQHRVLTYCFSNFGEPIAYVQGCSPTESWSIPVAITAEQYQNRTDAKVGDYSHKHTVVFLSRLAIDGFPEPEWENGWK